MFVAGVVLGTFVGGALGVMALTLASMGAAADRLIEQEARTDQDSRDRVLLSD